MENAAPPVVLFDGVCNLCTASVQFIVARDPRGTIRFASLQSRAAGRLLAPLGVTPAPEPQTVLLLEDGRLYTRSTAALRIARKLSGLWPLLIVFLAVPRPLRDAVYDFIGRHRYRWFGRTEACWLPTPALRARFLDAGEAAA